MDSSDTHSCDVWTWIKVCHLVSMWMYHLYLFPNIAKVRLNAYCVRFLCSHVQHIRYVLVFLLLYFSRGFFIYSPPPVHLYIWAPDPQMNTSTIPNMASSQNLGIFSPRCTAWLTLQSPLFWSILSSIFIITRSCFDQHLFFITTPRRDSAAAAVSNTRHRRLPICYSRPAADWIGLESPPWIEIDSVAIGRRPLRSVSLQSDRCCFTPAWLG
jgi:hypothetical protein